MSKNYETVIGLEVHVELATKTKIFCGCSTAVRRSTKYTYLPGLHRYAGFPSGVEQTGGGICHGSRSGYKLQHYPDTVNLTGRTISIRIIRRTIRSPSCICQSAADGYVEIETSRQAKKQVRIHEIHMEEDAGKLVHDEWEDASIVDYNRSGVPLIEIVSEPDMRSADEVIAYLEKLRLIIQYLGASDCKLQEGSMRADVNLSVREVGSPKFGTRTEMKNLNSFKAIAHAIEGERERQIELLEMAKNSCPGNQKMG